MLKMPCQFETIVNALVFFMKNSTPWFCNYLEINRLPMNIETREMLCGGVGPAKNRPELN